MAPWFVGLRRRDGLIHDLANRGEHFIRHLRRAGVHEKHAFESDRHRNVVAVGNHHIDVALDRQDMDIAVLRRLIGNFLRRVYSRF